MLFAERCTLPRSVPAEDVRPGPRSVSSPEPGRAADTAEPAERRGPPT